MICRCGCSACDCTRQCLCTSSNCFCAECRDLRRQYDMILGIARKYESQGCNEVSPDPYSSNDSEKSELEASTIEAPKRERTLQFKMEGFDSSPESRPQSSCSRTSVLFDKSENFPADDTDITQVILEEKSRKCGENSSLYNPSGDGSGSSTEVKPEEESKQYARKSSVCIPIDGESGSNIAERRIKSQEEEPKISAENSSLYNPSVEESGSSIVVIPKEEPEQCTKKSDLHIPVHVAKSLISGLNAGERQSADEVSKNYQEKSSLHNSSDDELGSSMEIIPEVESETERKIKSTEVSKKRVESSGMYNPSDDESGSSMEVITEEESKQYSRKSTSDIPGNGESGSGMAERKRKSSEEESKKYSENSRLYNPSDDESGSSIEVITEEEVEMCKKVKFA